MWFLWCLFVFMVFMVIVVTLVIMVPKIHKHFVRCIKIDEIVIILEKSYKVAGGWMGGWE
jgi:hypothetical protein